jgi:hypothetical protein
MFKSRFFWAEFSIAKIQFKISRKIVKYTHMVQVSSQKHIRGVFKKLLSYLACTQICLNLHIYGWLLLWVHHKIDPRKHKTDITKLTQKNRKQNWVHHKTDPRKQKTELGTSQNWPKKTKKQNWVHHRIWVQLRTTFVYMCCFQSIFNIFILSWFIYYDHDVISAS